MYPHDWVTLDPTHLKPASVQTNFSTIPSGGTRIAKFRLSASQVGQLAGWHPCLVTEVESDNDYGTAAGQRVWQNNNLAQRNVSVESAPAGGTVAFPFVTGHQLDEDTFMELVVDRRQLPEGIELLLDPFDTGTYFPDLDIDRDRTSDDGIRFLDRTRIEVSMCGCDGILTLEEGSTFECSDNSNRRADDVAIEGGEFVTRDDERLISIRGDQAVIGIPKRAGERRQMSLRFDVPEDADVDETYRIDVSQRNSGPGTVGGVSLEVEVRD